MYISIYVAGWQYLISFFLIPYILKFKIHKPLGLSNSISKILFWDFPGGAVVKNPPANAGIQVRALVREDPTCRRATRPVRHNY